MRQSQGVTAFASGRLLHPEPTTATLSLTAEGDLLVVVRDHVFLHAEAAIACSAGLRAHPVAHTDRGSGRSASSLREIRGDGHLLCASRGEHYAVLRLERDLCFFREDRVHAVEATLLWDVGRIPGSRAPGRGGGIPLVRAAGEGLLAIRTRAEVLAVKVTPERPFRLSLAHLVGWVGNVVPQVLRRREVLQCEGEGAVFLDPKGYASPHEECAA